MRKRCCFKTIQLLFIDNLKKIFQVVVKLEVSWTSELYETHRRVTTEGTLKLRVRATSLAFTCLHVLSNRGQLFPVVIRKPIICMTQKVQWQKLRQSADFLEKSRSAALQTRASLYQQRSPSSCLGQLAQRRKVLDLRLWCQQSSPLRARRVGLLVKLTS